jgi:hypothetical protein
VVDTIYEVENIKNAIAERVQNETKYVSDVYGGGNAGIQIANLLETLPLQFHKTIMY